MKKRFIEPTFKVIKLNLSENIAESVDLFNGIVGIIFTTTQVAKDPCTAIITDSTENPGMFASTELARAWFNAHKGELVGCMDIAVVDEGSAYEDPMTTRSTTVLEVPRDVANEFGFY